MGIRKTSEIAILLNLGSDQGALSPGNLGPLRCSISLCISTSPHLVSLAATLVKRTVAERIVATVTGCTEFS